MWEGELGDQGRGHNKQGNPLRMNLIPGTTRFKRIERRTILSFAKLKFQSSLKANWATPVFDIKRAMDGRRNRVKFKQDMGVTKPVYN